MSKPEENVARGAMQGVSMDPAIGAAARRVMERCEVLGGISDEEGKITRTFLSPAAKRAQAVVAGWMREAGLTVRVDAAGNVIGRREAGRSDSGLAGKTFAIGSHLDTVPNAGKYDGILGVMAGIEIAELMREEALPFALEVVGFSEEEGVRFGKPYIGSHAYAGTLDAGWLELTDREGATVEQAIRDFGLEPELLKELRARADLLGYLELHIEQGPEMERSGFSVAAVGSIAGQTRLNLRMAGEAGHAGTTPMDLRRDALAAAAEGILAVEAFAIETRGEGNSPLVATVGQIRAWPNSTNVIAGEVQFSVDLRHANDVVRRRGVDSVLERLRGIAQRRGVSFEITARGDFAAVPMASGFVVNLLHACEVHSGRRALMVSGAGHDATVMAGVTRAAMLFVRSPGGISHNPRETVLEEDVAVALAAATEFVRKFEPIDQGHA